MLDNAVAAALPEGGAAPAAPAAPAAAASPSTSAAPAAAQQAPAQAQPGAAQAGAGAGAVDASSIVRDHRPLMCNADDYMRMAAVPHVPPVGAAAGCEEEGGAALTEAGTNFRGMRGVVVNSNGERTRLPGLWAGMYGMYLWPRL